MVLFISGLPLASGLLKSTFAINHDEDQLGSKERGKLLQLRFVPKAKFLDTFASLVSTTVTVKA